MAKRENKAPKHKAPAKQPLDKVALQEKIRAQFEQSFGHEDRGCRYFHKEKEK